MKYKNFLVATLLFLGLVLSAHLAHASGVSLLDGKNTATFSTSDYGTVRFVTPGDSLATAGATPVSVSSTGMTGQAWGDHVGWIQLDQGPSGQGVTVACSGTAATLSGYAWGENTGWINFGPFTGDAAGSQGTIDATGFFSGAAWSQNFGWLTFSNLHASSSPCSGSSNPAPVQIQPVTGGSAGGGCGFPRVWDSKNRICVLTSASVAGLIPTSVPSVATDAHLLTRSLSLGTRDPAVRDLQRFLNGHGFQVAKSGTGSPGHESNYFGRTTRSALMKFQKANKLKSDGKLGPITRALINSLAASH